MAEKLENWPKNGEKVHFWANLPIFRPFFPPFPGGAEIHFSAIFFPISGRRPDLGCVQGNRDRNSGPQSHNLSQSARGSKPVCLLVGFFAGLGVSEHPEDQGFPNLSLRQGG